MKDAWNYPVTFGWSRKCGLTNFMISFIADIASSKRSRGSSSDTTRISLFNMNLIIEKLKSLQNRQSMKTMYLSIWQQFNKFLRRLDSIPDSWEDRTTLFMEHLVHDRKLQSSTIRSYVSAIKCTLVDNDYDWQDSALLLRTLTRACRQINDKVRMRLPIHCALLEQILFEVERIFRQKGQWYLEILYKTIFLLGYYGLMRIGEMTSGPHVLKAKDVHLAKNKYKLLLVLHTSKTHNEGNPPQQIKIIANVDEKSGAYRKRHFYPMRTVNKFIAIRGPFATTDEQFFIFRDKTPVMPVQVATVL